jgi:hypothetical protein
MNQNLVGSTYERFCIKFPQSRMKGSFGKAVSEKKIFLEINHSETRIACGGHVC